MPGPRSEMGDPEALFTAVNRLLATPSEIGVRGLPNLTTQSYFLTRNPELQHRVIFWLLSTEELPSAQRLLEYWHRQYKINRRLWQLDQVTPARLAQLSAHEPHVVLADLAQLEAKLPAVSVVEDHLLNLTKNQSTQPAALSQQLISMGYDFSTHASEAGYFARHGGIMDVFPMNTDRPLRIEFNATGIEQMQWFNPVDKRLAETVEHAQIIARKFKSHHTRASFTQYLSALERPVLFYNDITEPPGIINDWEAIEKEFKHYSRIVVKDFDTAARTLAFEHAPLYHKGFEQLAEDIKKFTGQHWRIAIATQQSHQLEKLFKEKKVAAPIHLWPMIRELSGFSNAPSKFLLLTDREIFGDVIEEQSPRKRVDQAFIMELQPGDFVVHLDHGIGQFAGMAQNVVEGITKEYFILEYSERDKLYVPVESADKISKYIGVSNPKLHRLSGGQWYQLTRKVKQEAKVLAQELLKIYAKREMTKIKPFGKDTAEDNELATSFPYRETPDQLSAIKAVKNDLEHETPMDRLICGDVGFGKTEVAVRAALKAVMNKTQVALLSPTTILTQQHYDTFKKRLKKFPISLGILSRFETDKEQKETIEGLKAGTIDIVIGTHRLLSSDVLFRRLGLIIIDEEQRFGVKAKERLKSLRTQAHVLTLTATPIPRTLNIALSGVRDVSVIETPPEGRLPIETHIEPYSDTAIQAVIKKELDRDGQVYYLHNKVETISHAALDIQKLIPNARIGIAHGRLPEKELAKAMADFDNMKTNILVCSTIIENGLDLPNVNTMIVDNSTNFGLAQLYQLRGRIGRGDRQAFAYFFYNRKKLIGNAKKRLQALMAAKRLGSGFQLALRDLEIRGAGNILGKEQHGKVSAIGLSLYTRLLAQAIEELKHGKVQETIRDIVLDLPMEAYIPKEFVGEEERLILYQKMAGVTTIEDLTELKQAIIRARTKEEQRHIPQPLLNLFEVLEVRIMAQRTDLSHIDTTQITDENGQRRRRIILKFLFPLKPENLARLLQRNPNWQFTDDSLKIDLDKLGDHWLEELKKVIRLYQHPEEKK
ncbi:MAG: transcription-repair coupling factor [Candidatus Kerfeldbacteria bacterium]|nr:transcription-repair coupling factor [Candidatus Kerfeldbacteria bacterium]